MTKTEFILKQKPTMSADDVVKRAKANKMKISKAFVYTIRSNAKSKAKKNGAPPRAKKAAVGVRKTSGGLETQFVSLACDIGITRSEELLKTVRQLAGE